MISSSGDEPLDINILHLETNTVGSRAWKKKKLLNTYRLAKYLIDCRSFRRTENDQNFLTHLKCPITARHRRAWHSYLLGPFLVAFSSEQSVFARGFLWTSPERDVRRCSLHRYGFSYVWRLVWLAHHKGTHGKYQAVSCGIPAWAFSALLKNFVVEVDMSIFAAFGFPDEKWLIKRPWTWW